MDGRIGEMDEFAQDVSGKTGGQMDGWVDG